MGRERPTFWVSTQGIGLPPVMGQFMEVFEHLPVGSSGERDFWRSGGSVFGRRSHPARIRSCAGEGRFAFMFGACDNSLGISETSMG